MAKKLVGKKCPAFKADATNNQIVENSSYSGMNVVIYFYPKDSTPGCTTEGQEFRDTYKPVSYTHLTLPTNLRV